MGRSPSPRRQRRRSRSPSPDRKRYQSKSPIREKEKTLRDKETRVSSKGSTNAKPKEKESIRWDDPARLFVDVKIKNIFIV